MAQRSGWSPQAPTRRCAVRQGNSQVGVWEDSEENIERRYEEAEWTHQGKAVIMGASKVGIYVGYVYIAKYLIILAMDVVCSHSSRQANRFPVYLLRQLSSFPELLLKSLQNSSRRNS